MKLHIALAHTYPWHENAEESFIGGRYHTPHSTRDIYLLYMGMVLGGWVMVVITSGYFVAVLIVLFSGWGCCWDVTLHCIHLSNKWENEEIKIKHFEDIGAVPMKRKQRQSSSRYAHRLLYTYAC